MDVAFDTTESLAPPRDERRWPAVLALLTAGWLPATTARRTDHLSIVWGVVLHGLSTFGVVAVLMVLSAAARVDGTLTLGAIAAQLGIHFTSHSDAGSGGAPYAFFWWRQVLILFVICEFFYLSVGFLSTPWGARDEPFRDSLTAALRRSWMHSPHVVWIVALTGGLIVFFDRADRSWRRDHTGFRSDISWDQWEATQPWYLRHDEEMIIVALTAAGMWLVWAMLRAVGAERRTPPVARPPTCEGCGYNLTGAAFEGRCAECGEAVAASLGPDVRRGTAWDRRGEVGALAAWWYCTVYPITQPNWFARQIRVTAPVAGHRMLLAGHLACVFVVASLGMTLFWIVEWGPANTVLDGSEFFAASMSAGVFSVGFGLATVLVAAWLVGLRHVIWGRRNLMSASMQIAAYLGGYLVLWAVWAAVSGVGVVYLEPAGYYYLNSSRWYDQDFVDFLIWLVPNVMLSIGFFVLVARGTAGARYANR